MKVFNLPSTSRGFSLIEALVALLVLGVLLGSLFRFQSQVLRGVFRTHGVIDRLPIIKNALTKIEQQSDKEISKKITDANTNTEITYELKAISEKSTLYAVKNLKQVVVIAQWPGLTGQQDVEFVGFKFYPVIPKTGSSV